MKKLSRTPEASRSYDAPNELLARAAGVLAIAAEWGHQFDRAVPADEVAASPQDLVTALRR
jgi:hypothetical protein